MSWDDMTREEEDATRQLISLEDEGIKSRKFDQGWSRIRTMSEYDLKTDDR